MKYSHQIEIDLPIYKVIELFDNPENMKHWQKGFISFEHLSGTPGNVGAKSRLKYKMGSREIEMVETIIARDLPKEFSGTYEAKGVWNEVRNYFSPAPGDKTVWISKNEFRGTGFMKIMMAIMPGMFKKQSYQIMADFKKFAESQ